MRTRGGKKGRDRKLRAHGQHDDHKNTEGIQCLQVSGYNKKNKKRLSKQAEINDKPQTAVTLQKQREALN